MVNTLEFIDRLKKVMDYYQLTATLFADKIGVQRSSISHILSGRNKPSLDFILKLTSNFEEVDIYWLLEGRGSFPKEANNSTSPALPLPDLNIEKPSYEKKINKIVVFYDDGTFEEYQK